MSAEYSREIPALADLTVSGVTYRRNLFGEWCEVSDESGELHVVYQESDCLDEIERLRDALIQMRDWDMLTLNTDGTGESLDDARWARQIIADALGEST
jgi:hypothetical protein